MYVIDHARDNVPTSPQLTMCPFITADFQEQHLYSGFVSLTKYLREMKHVLA